MWLTSLRGTSWHFGGEVWQTTVTCPSPILLCRNTGLLHHANVPVTETQVGALALRLNLYTETERKNHASKL